MRLGCCGSLDQAAAFKAAGFDFLEIIITATLKGDLPSSEYDATAPDPDKVALPVEAGNCLVPAHRPIIGPQRDFVGLQDYIQRVAKRGQRFGIQRFVFGSGGARKRPEGVDEATAWQHLQEFARMTGEVCAHHGIMLVIEHLYSAETNTLNKLAQAKALCDEVSHPNVQMLVDSFHYGHEKEEDEIIFDLGSSIRHVHISELEGRAQPGAHGPVGPNNPKAFDFEHFFSLLRKVGYNERIAVEAKWTKPVQEIGPQVIAQLRQAWESADKVEA